MALHPFRRSWRADSVGRKLSAAILAVVLLVAAAVYWGLSRYERQSRFEAKEQAAAMVMQLFAANLSAPLTFADAASTADAIASVSQNPEIELAAAWAVSPERPDALGEQVGTLSRGRAAVAPPPADLAALRTTLQSTRVVVEAPVKDPQGKLVGVAQLAFSTAREEATIGEIERRVLWLSGGVALGLVIILSLASRAVVVRPLRRLTRAAAALKRGEKPEALSPTRDEMGELNRAFMEMSLAIETREAEVVARNRDMARILDNAEDGFITVNRDGAMSDERSRILERWFGPAPSADFLRYFAQICPARGKEMRLCWEALIEEVMPLEVLLEQMPASFEREGRHFQLRYRTIPGTTRELESLLVVIHDATAALRQQRAEERQREQLVVFRRLMMDSAGWELFFEDGTSVVRQLVGSPPPDDLTTRRMVHTLKGNCAVMGVESLATFLHDVEGRFAPGEARLRSDDADSLARRWEDLGAMCAELGGRVDKGRVTITRAEHEALLDAITRSGELRGLAGRVARWRDDLVADRLAHVRDQLQSLSRRLGKGEAEVVLDVGDLRVSNRAYAALWSALAHLVRNIVDHGFQTATERVALGKSPTNRVFLSAHEDGDRGFVLSIGDDGRGIDWKTLASKAAAAGLPTRTRAELERALYADSVSTRDSASETSGRGVGLGAVQAALSSLRGRIELETAEGKGTTFRLFLPWLEVSSAPHRPSNSPSSSTILESATFRVADAVKASGWSSGGR